MAKKQKLDLTPTGAGLHNPFAALDAEKVGRVTPCAPLSQEAGHATPPLPASPPPSAVAKPSKFGRVVLRREKAHRGGKTVIVIDDFAPNIGLRYLEDLASRLKSACACGGTTRGRAIEIQGDQPARIRALLEQEGFRVAGVT